MCRIITVQKHVCVDHIRHERGTQLFSRSKSSRVVGFLFFTHFFDCTEKTELIYRSNCSENSCNCFQVATIEDRQISTAFAIDLTSGQWTRDSKDWMSAFCECDHHQLSHFVPFTLFIVFIDRRSLFSEPKQRNDHCLSPHLLANRETSSAFDSHSFLFFFDPLAVSLNIDMKIIRLVNFSGVSPNLNRKS